MKKKTQEKVFTQTALKSKMCNNESNFIADCFRANFLKIKITSAYSVVEE